MKKLFLLSLFLVVLSGCTADYSAAPINQTNLQTPAAVEAPTKVDVEKSASKAVEGSEVKIDAQAIDPVVKTSENVELSNDDYYTNSTGNEVHSPAYAPSIPPGASARCKDGTYSFSQSRRGTCSHHGGVAEWY